MAVPAFEAAISNATSGATSAATAAPASAASGGAGLFNPYTFALMVAINWYTGRKADEEERKVRLQAVRDAVQQSRNTAAGTILPLAYGPAAVPGIPIYNTSGANLPKIPSKIVGNFNKLDNAANGWGWGRENQFVLEQFAIASGDIEGLVDVLVNGEYITGDRYGGFIGAEFSTQGVASEMATAFTARGASVTGGSTGTGTLERTAASVGTGISKATVVYNLLPSDLRFPGPPGLQFLIKGRKCRYFNSDGSLNSGKRYTTNPILILLDFLLDDIVGVAAKESEFDMPLMKAAADQCDVMVQGPNSAITTQTLTPNDVVRYPTVGTYGEAYTHLNLENKSGLVNNHINGSSAASLDLKRYEFGGFFDTFESADRIIGAILATMPFSVFERTDEGKWYIDIPKETAESGQSIKTITDTDMFDHLQVDYPSFQSTVSRHTVSFDSVNRDLATETEEFPERSGSLETQFSDFFNGLVFPKITSIPGLLDRYHAETYAATAMAASFRDMYRFQLPREDHHDLRAGAVVRITSALHGEDHYARILARESLDLQRVLFTAIQFDKDDYRWRVYNADEFDIDAISPTTINPPSAFTAAVAGASVQLDWTPPNNLSVLVIQSTIEFKIDTGDWEHLVTIPVGRRASDQETESARSYLHSITVPGDVTYRIRNETADLEKFSTWLESSTVTVSAVVGGTGPRGPKGDQGIAGIAGTDGSDGSSIEHVFAATGNDDALTAAQKPLNSWKFDAPAADSNGYITRDGIRWYDGTPANASHSVPWIREFRRAYIGPEPADGEYPARVAYDAVPADGEFAAKDWVEQEPIRAFGTPGANAGDLNTVYLRSATKPATPTAGTDEIPTGWVDDPPTGTNQLWASNGSEDPDTGEWTWLEPVKAFERTEPPTVAASVTGDDVRVTVTDPTDTTGITGHRITLERLEGGDWRDVDRITHRGLTTNVGRGKTFGQLPAGQYRAEVQTTVSPGFIESAYVTSSTVTAVDAPEVPPKATIAPTLTFSDGFLMVAYADPTDTGNSPLTNFDIDVRKDGTGDANKIFVDTHGVLQGRSVVFAITESGTYYARTRANSVDGKGAWGPFSDGLAVTATSAEGAKGDKGDKGDTGGAGPAGEDGDNAIFFLQPVVEVPVAADGVSITEAVFFDPNPTIVVLTRVNEDGTTTDLNVTLEISATGVIATLDNTTEFDIVN